MILAKDAFIFHQLTDLSINKISKKVKIEQLDGDVKIDSSFHPYDGIV